MKCDICGRVELKFEVPVNKNGQMMCGECASKEFNCNTCTNPTKYIFGLWDGENGTHGKMFECHNLKCETKQARDRVTEFLEGNSKVVISANEGNGINMELIKAKRKKLQITIMKMSQGLGISPATYSHYEQCREALPVEMVGRIEGVFQDAIDKHLYAPRLKPEFGGIRWDVKA